tara:strand:+ start:75 stop:260 length:186 start_codon:yes stop_codon:yes gene_type:complete
MPLRVNPDAESSPSIVLFEFCTPVLTPSPALGNRLPDVAVSAKLFTLTKVVRVNIVSENDQ